jgi:hypothetical protein
MLNKILWNRRTILGAVAAGVFLLPFTIRTTRGNPDGHKTGETVADQLTGTWLLVSMQNDKKVEILGEHPLGMLVFDSGGHFASQVRRSDLPKFASPDRTKATPDESQVIVRGSMALYGTYTVDKGTLHLHVVSSAFPNWDGADQVRTVILQEDTLELTNLTNSFGESAVHAFWKRASPVPHH